MKRVVTASVLTALLAGLLAINTPPLLQQNKPDVAKNTLIATHIYDQLNANLGHPIVVAQSMSADSLLKDALKHEKATSEQDMERMMTSYLSAYKNQFGYIAVFVVSEQTHRYYTPNGIAKIVNPKEEPYDIWYQLFLDSGKAVDLDTDRDQANDYRWAVFANARIEDEDGTVLGVCGVGLFMDALQEVVEKAEHEYGLKINLVDEEGMVQVDSDSTNIENAYIPEVVSDKATEKEFVYTQKANGSFRLTRFMQFLEWYLVVQNFSHAKSNLVAIGMVAGMFVLLILLLLLHFWNKKTVSSHALVKTALPEDPLTHLPNRNYLKESFGELGVFNTTRYKSLAMFDIDRFKFINETREGDVIIVSIVKLFQEAFGEKALLFRWSGDEFVAFLEVDAEEAEQRFTDLCSSIQTQLDVTISAGIVTVDLSESIKTNYHRAVQHCYAVKEKGGNGVERARS